MACNLYNNDGFGCGSCVHFVRTNSVTLLDNGNLVLDIPEPLVSLSNKQKICICVVQTIPTGTTGNGALFITFNGGTTYYPVRTKCSNIVRADQIRSRKLYHTFIATDTGTFVISDCELCPTSFIFPIINP